jgi:hypothetical protein
LIEVLRAAEWDGEEATPAEGGDLGELDSDGVRHLRTDIEPNEMARLRDESPHEEEEEAGEDDSEAMSEAERDIAEGQEAAETRPGATRAKPPRRPPAKVRGWKAKRDGAADHACLGVHLLPHCVRDELTADGGFRLLL